MGLMTRKMGIIATVLFGAGATVGCGGSSANRPPPAAAASVGADDASAGLVEYHRHHHHGGVTLFIAMSLDTLGVSPEQRAAVEKIRTDLGSRMDTARTAEQTLLGTLADGVVAASFDAAKVDDGVGKSVAAVAAMHDASADALIALHALLTPAQRGALVEKVESHWAVWQNANAEESSPTSPKGGHLAMLTTELDLAPDQVAKIRAALGEAMKAVPRVDPHDIAAHLRAFGDAFRTEKFDARVLTAASATDAHLVGWGAARLTRFVETASAGLTADQRAKLAQMLREHATHTAQGKP